MIGWTAPRTASACQDGRGQNPSKGSRPWASLTGICRLSRGLVSIWRRGCFRFTPSTRRGEIVVAHKLTRSQLGLFFAEMPPCVVAMEACSSAHHWGETLIAFGHEVRSLPPAHVKPCIRADCNSVESGTVGAVADRAGRAPKGVRKNARLTAGYRARLQGPGRPKSNLL